LSLSGPTAFQGTFEGLGNTISGLSINDPNDTEVGLFAASNGTLRDINLTNVDVIDLGASGDVGALVADSTGMIEAVQVSGKVVGVSASFAGGIVGINDTGGAITSSQSSARVSAGDYTLIGGVAGESDGTIENSSASGNVSASPNAIIGGLVGENSGTISNSHVSGNVNADLNLGAGGLIGSNTGNVISSYATGDVNGGTEGCASCGNGGLVGDTSLHTLRHTFASVGADLGYSELTIAGLLGHRGSSVTARYAHVPDRALLTAADHIASQIDRALNGEATFLPFNMSVTG
jgi:The GLUG motif